MANMKLLCIIAMAVLLTINTGTLARSMVPKSNDLIDELIGCYTRMSNCQRNKDRDSCQELDVAYCMKTTDCPRETSFGLFCASVPRLRTD